MQDEANTKEQLIIQLKALRRRVAELEKDMGASTKPADLRRHEDEWLKTRQTETDQCETHDTERPYHELAAHHVDLEIQNEELNRANALVEETCNRYVDLYELAPIAYLTLDENGILIEANLTAAVQLGIERSDLIKRPFQDYIVPTDRDKFRSHLNDVVTSEKRHSCEIGLMRRSGGDFYALLDTSFTLSPSGKKLCRTTATDITQRKRAENFVNVRLSLLEFAAYHSSAELLQKTLDEISQLTKRLHRVSPFRRERSENPFTPGMVNENAERILRSGGERRTLSNRKGGGVGRTVFMKSVR